MVNIIIMLQLRSRFLNSDQTVWSDRINCEPLTNTVLLVLRTSLCQKSREPFKPWSNYTISRTVIRPLLTVPYFPLNLNLKKKNKKNKKQKKKTKRKTKKNTEKQVLNSTPFRVHHAAPFRVFTRLQPLLKAEASTTVRCYQT